MSNPPMVHIIDDDEPVRDAISMLLETVGLEHQTHASAVEFLESTNPAEAGCLVLDIRMPGISGLDLQQQLLEQQLEVPIIFITGHGDIPMAVEAMRRGAVDFIRKPFRDQDLLDRIQEALAVGEQQQARIARLKEARKKVADLTKREQEVFERVAQGQANKVIAIELGISERTVEIHRSHVMQKTASRTLADLVRLHLSLEPALPGETK